VTVGDPGAGEARIRHTAVGLNYVDVYYRTGLYKPPSYPFVPARSGGVVEAVGPGVSDVKPGMRVAYGVAPLGAYSQARLVPADRLVELPAGIDDRTAAAMMLKGMTAHYLLLRIGPDQEGATRSWSTRRPAASDSSRCQWARSLGAP